MLPCPAITCVMQQKPPLNTHCQTLTTEAAQYPPRHVRLYRHMTLPHVTISSLLYGVVLQLWHLISLLLLLPLLLLCCFYYYHYHCHYHYHYHYYYRHYNQMHRDR